MTKKLANLVCGEIFTYAKERFVVLEQTIVGTFVLLEHSTDAVPFHEGDDNPRNNYGKSSLKQYIEDKWLKKLFANGADEADMHIFNVNLSETDGSNAYGLIEVKAAPLTLAQFGKYKNVITFAEDDRWWLVTPFFGQRSNNSTYTSSAWYVKGSNTAYADVVTSKLGVLPALMLSSDLLVSVDDEEESENVEKALAKFDTLTLMIEVGRRIERRMTSKESECGCDNEDDEE